MTRRKRQGCTRAFLRALRTRPEPRDLRAVMARVPQGTAVGAISVLVFVTYAWPSVGGGPLAIWGGLTLICGALAASVALSLARYDDDIVSRRLLRKLVFAAILTASPWAVLALVTATAGTPSELRMLAIVLCIGRVAGATLILHRFFAACLAYQTTVLAALLLSTLHVGLATEWALAAVSMLLGGYLAITAWCVGETSRERDASHKALEEANDRIARLAYVDHVTGLPNRKAFMDRLVEAIAEAEVTGTKFAVFMLDLDRFKNINDTFGHQIGDALLALVGRRLAARLGPRDVLARLGGDEFAIIVQDRSDPDAITALAHNLIEGLAEPAWLDSRQVFPGTSIGGVVYPGNGREPGMLLAKADMALARAKEAGRGHFTLFDARLRAHIERQDWVEVQLQQALDRREIRLAYQPIFELATGAYAGAEALVRWEHPERGPITPAEFLPVAAERGLLPAVTNAVLQTIGGDILGWQAAGIDLGRIAINLHPLDLKSPVDLLASLRALAVSGVGPERVVIEVTEEAFMGRGTDTVPLILDAIADLGFEISLDDFGMGHASLAHLRKLPVSEIKLDRSFVIGLVSSRPDRAVVAATVEIARIMGMRVVAEGVETEGQRLALETHGVGFGQGFLWSGAFDAASLADLFGRTAEMPAETGAVPGPRPRRRVRDGGALAAQ